MQSASGMEAVALVADGRSHQPHVAFLGMRTLLGVAKSRLFT